MTGSPMSAVFEEKFGSSIVQRSSVPAGTRMSCAFVLAGTPKTNKPTAKYPIVRRMYYLPVCRSGRTGSIRRHGDETPEHEREECTARTHPMFAPRIFSRSVVANYAYSRNGFNRQDLRGFRHELCRVKNTKP